MRYLKRTGRTAICLIPSNALGVERASAAAAAQQIPSRFKLSQSCDEQRFGESELVWATPTGGTGNSDSGN